MTVSVQTNSVFGSPNENKKEQGVESRIVVSNNGDVLHGPQIEEEE